MEALHVAGTQTDVRCRPATRRKDEAMEAFRPSCAGDEERLLGGKNLKIKHEIDIYQTGTVMCV